MSQGVRWTEFKPYEKNLVKVLGDLEADVLEALWKLKVAHVRDIHREVARKRKVAVTTVATVLDRLFEKGLVERELKRTRGLYYEYRPSLTKRQFESTIVRDVLKGLFETFGDAAVSYLINQVGIKDEQKVEEFKVYLEKLKQEEESS